VTTEDDLCRIADAVRGKNVAVFSDEPYCHMIWKGKHHSILSQPGMMDQSVAAFTFSKSYSMSGWRLGFAVSSAEIADAIGKMINTTLSCTPPLVQLAGAAALERDSVERDAVMKKFREKVELLTSGLNRIEGFRTLDPTAHVLRLSQRHGGLPAVRNSKPRAGAVSIGRSRRQVRRGLPGGRMFRRGRPGFPAVQLRGAEREVAAGTRFPSRGDLADRPRRGLPRKTPVRPKKPYSVDGESARHVGDAMDVVAVRGNSPSVAAVLPRFRRNWLTLATYCTIHRHAHSVATFERCRHFDKLMHFGRICRLAFDRIDPARAAFKKNSVGVLLASPLRHHTNCCNTC
jgi:hypothetical protein